MLLKPAPTCPGSFSLAPASGCCCDRAPGCGASRDRSGFSLSPADGGLPLRASGRVLPTSLSFGEVAGHPRGSLACRCATPVSASSVWGPLPSACGCLGLYSLLMRKPLTGLGPTLTQSDLTLTDYVCRHLISKSGHMLRFQVDLNSGDIIQPSAPFYTPQDLLGTLGTSLPSHAQDLLSPPGPSLSPGCFLRPCPPLPALPPYPTLPPGRAEVPLSHPAFPAA